MATAAPSDQAADLLQKLSLDVQTNTLEIHDPATVKSSTNQIASTDTGSAANVQIQPSDPSVTPSLPEYIDPSVCYLSNGYPSYYYGGYGGTGNEWDYSQYVNHGGVEMPTGVYGDNGSVMYHPGYGYPYTPYSPAGSPVPTMGNDGQLYGPQHYQYPYFQPLTPANEQYNSGPAPAQGDVSSSVAADQKPLPVDAPNGKTNSLSNVGVKGTTTAPLKQSFQNPSINSNGYGRNSLFDGAQPPVSWSDGPLFIDGQSKPLNSTAITSFSNPNNVPSSRNQNLRPNSHYVNLHHPRPISGMGSANGFMNRLYPNKLYGQYGNALGSAFGSNGYGSRTNGRGWYSVDKYKPRGRGNGYFGYGNESMDGLNELNRGPRAKGSKNQRGFAPITLAVKGQNLPSNGTDDGDKGKTDLTPDIKEYNQADFPVEYANAKFFIIKSYSEDDVHKSIKYSVWASTPNGNKKLDAAYQEAQEKSDGCPIFLFFSVNTSGQFVGLAEMVGPVDFNKNCEYWQQDKWNGCFSVKWHIVKDVPNSLLKHVTLENNENKPVTNSRDTQEVKLEQGLKMIKIFKDHSSKTCILDDFGFYEDRQKAIQEKKAKQQQLQKQVWDKAAPYEKREEANGEIKSLKSSEVVSELLDEPTLTAVSKGDEKLSERDSDGPKGVIPTPPSEKVVANGVANSC